MMWIAISIVFSFFYKNQYLASFNRGETVNFATAVFENYSLKYIDKSIEKKDNCFL